MDKSAVANSVVTSIVSSLSLIAGDITSTITQIAPIACGIAGLFMAWKFGIKFFKSVAK